MGSMALDRNQYDGVFYCRKCGRPIHCFFVLIKNEKCACGSRGFISNIDYRIPELLEHIEEMIEETGMKIP